MDMKWIGSAVVGMSALLYQFVSPSSRDVSDDKRGSIASQDNDLVLASVQALDAKLSSFAGSNTELKSTVMDSLDQMRLRLSAIELSKSTDFGALEDQIAKLQSDVESGKARLVAYQETLPLGGFEQRVNEQGAELRNAVDGIFSRQEKVEQRISKLEESETAEPGCCAELREKLRALEAKVATLEQSKTVPQSYSGYGSSSATGYGSSGSVSYGSTGSRVVTTYSTSPAPVAVVRQSPSRTVTRTAPVVTTQSFSAPVETSGTCYIDPVTGQQTCTQTSSTRVPTLNRYPLRSILRR